MHRTKGLTFIIVFLMSALALWDVGAGAGPGDLGIDPAGAGAPPPILYPNPGRDYITLAEHLELMADATRELTLNDVLLPPASQRFQPHREGDTLSLGLSNSAVWLRLRVSGGEAWRGWVIELDNTQYDRVDFFLPRTASGGEINYQQYTTGLMFPADQRPVTFRSFAIELPPDLAPGEPLFIRVVSRNTLTVCPIAWSPRGWQGRLTSDGYFFGAVLGVLLAMLFYNLFIYISLGDRAYIFYITYLASMVLFTVGTFGQLSLVLDPPPALAYGIIWTGVGGLMLMAALFSRVFLRSSFYAPILDRLILAAGASGILVAGLGWGGLVSLASLIAHVMGLVEPCLILIASIVCVRKGFGAARFFLPAWILVIVGVVAFAATGLGILPHGLSYTEVLPATAALEAVLLSFALADRIRLLRTEAAEAKEREERYRELSFTDGLTGLFNQRFLLERLTAELSPSLRRGDPLCLLMIDVDDFKTYNDAYGHPAGDEVLRRLGLTLQSTVRGADYACRYGGEEFVVILPRTDAERAVLVAERIRMNFAGQTFRPRSGVVRSVTISVGLAQAKVHDDVQQLISRADQALYRAKRAGKNQTVAAEA